MKLNPIIFLILILLIFLIGCNEKKLNSAAPYFGETVSWLEKDSNYANTSHYQSVFFREYQDQITHKNYENAKWLLYNYGAISFANNDYDSLFSKTNTDFIGKNYPVKKDTIWSWNYYFLSDQNEKGEHYEKAIYFGKKSLEVNPDRYSYIYFKALNHVGVSYSNLYQHEEAISYFVKAISLAEKKKNYREMGSLYNNVAFSYEQVFATEESKKYYKKATYYFLKAKDTSNYFALQSTIAYNQFNVSRDTLPTIQMIDQAFSVFNHFKNKTAEDQCNADFTRAFKYFLLKDYDKALTYLDKSSAFYIKTNNLDFLKYNDHLKIEINFRKYGFLKNKNAVELLAADMYKSDSFTESMDLYTILSQNELKANNSEKALFFKNKASQIENEILKNNQNGRLFEIEKKYQAEKKEKIITEQKSRLAQNNLYLIILIIAILILILATILFFMRRKRKEMVESNKRQEQFTFQLLQNTEEERNRIANELHDSVNHDLLNIKNTLINGKNIEVKTVENVIEEVRNISKNLHPAVLQNMGFEASIEALCERLTNEAGLFTTCDIEYDKKLSKSKELQLYRIIQEALNNTLKHGKANAAKVIVVSSESKLHVEIKDNGNGFNVTEQMNSSKSFGLQSILQRAKAIAAKINIESSEKGTKISLNINF